MRQAKASRHQSKRSSAPASLLKRPTQTHTRSISTSPHKKHAQRTSKKTDSQNISAMTQTSNLFRKTSSHHGKSTRYREVAEKVIYKIPIDRIKQTGTHAVVGYFHEDGSLPVYPDPISPLEKTYRTRDRVKKEKEDYQKHLAEGGEPRKYPLRKRYLYDRNREILGKSKITMVIQPLDDPEFYVIMEKLRGHFDTAHFRNGLVHLDGTSYPQLKEFFKGPIRVLIQNDETKIFSSFKKLQSVLKEHPNTLFLGGAIDGWAGVVSDFEPLKEYESKQQIQGHLIGALNSVSSLIPVIQYPTSSLARVMHHHEGELQKKQQV